MQKNSIQRYSPQREMILNYVKNTKVHPTADMVYGKMREIFPSISLGTVYRNLQALSENGIINKLTTASGAVRFDGDIDSHIHFICNSCGKIFDIEDKTHSVLPKTEHKIINRSVTYNGICKSCLSLTKNQ